MKTIEIDGKLYRDIEAYCTANAIEPEKYIIKVLRERIATDKYGDLNEKFRKQEEPVHVDEVPPKHETPKAETQTVSQEPLAETNEEVVTEKKQEPVSEPVDFAKVIEDINTEEKPKKKRTLKTK